MLRLTLESCANMTRRHDWFLIENQQAVEASLQIAGMRGVERVQTNPSFKPRTGKLQKATKAKVVKLGSGRVLRLSNDKPYAAAIDKGSKPHKIRAKRHMGHMLKFRGKGGQWVSKRVVNHPGTKATRFLQRATLTARNEFQDQFERRMSAIAARF